MKITIETISREYPIVVKLVINELDTAVKVFFEMYAQNVCQQLEWNNGKTATEFATEGARKLLGLHTKTGVIGAAILFGICIRKQLDWNNGKYATEVATIAGVTILSMDTQYGIEICQDLFSICINQQLKWNNGRYAKDITDSFANIITKYVT